MLLASRDFPGQLPLCSNALFGRAAACCADSEPQAARLCASGPRIAPLLAARELAAVGAGGAWRFRQPASVRLKAAPAGLEFSPVAPHDFAVANSLQVDLFLPPTYRFMGREATVRTKTRSSHRRFKQTAARDARRHLRSSPACTHDGDGWVVIELTEEARSARECAHDMLSCLPGCALRALVFTNGVKVPTVAPTGAYRRHAQEPSVLPVEDL